MFPGEDQVWCMLCGDRGASACEAAWTGCARGTCDSCSESVDVLLGVQDGLKGHCLRCRAEDALQVLRLTPPERSKSDCVGSLAAVDYGEMEQGAAAALAILRGGEVPVSERRRGRGLRMTLVERARMLTELAALDGDRNATGAQVVGGVDHQRMSRVVDDGRTADEVTIDAVCTISSESAKRRRMAEETVQLVCRDEAHMEGLDGCVDDDGLEGACTDDHLKGKSMLRMANRVRDLDDLVDHHRHEANVIDSSGMQRAPPCVVMAQRERLEELSHQPTKQVARGKQ